MPVFRAQLLKLFQIVVFIEIIILYIGLRSWYIYYKKKEIENDKRMLVLEKRIDNLYAEFLKYKHLLEDVEVTGL